MLRRIFIAVSLGVVALAQSSEERREHLSDTIFKATNSHWISVSPGDFVYFQPVAYLLGSDRFGLRVARGEQ